MALKWTTALELKVYIYILARSVHCLGKMLSHFSGTVFPRASYHCCYTCEGALPLILQYTALSLSTVVYTEYRDGLHAHDRWMYGATVLV